ncbi:MAG: PEP-CTERM sorting domain-containing protein [Pseudomonadota bacterium]
MKRTTLGRLAAAMLLLPTVASAGLMEITATYAGDVYTDYVFTDFTVIYQDGNADGLLQFEEIVEFSGFTNLSDGRMWDEIVGVPDIAGVATASGYSNGNDIFWWVLPSPLYRPNAWFATRWRYATGELPATPVSISEPETLGLLGLGLAAMAFARRRRRG